MILIIFYRFLKGENIFVISAYNFFVCNVLTGYLLIYVGDGINTLKINELMIVFGIAIGIYAS